MKGILIPWCCNLCCGTVKMWIVENYLVAFRELVYIKSCKFACLKDFFVLKSVKLFASFLGINKSNIDICKLFVKRVKEEQTILKIKYHVKNL